MLVGFKVRIYPNKTQEEFLLHCCKQSHKMWNFVVGKWAKEEKLPNCNSFNPIGYNTQNLQEDFIDTLIPKRLYVEVLKRYSLACKRVFKKIGKRPKFHKYNPNKQSFCISSQTIKIKNNTINIPKAQKSNLKLGECPIDMQFLNKYGIETIKELRFTYLYGKWYVSGSSEVNIPEYKKIDNQLGLDWGIKDFMTDNNGNKINYPKSVLRQYQRVNSLKSKLSKKSKDSNNYNKLKLKIEKAYNRFENLKKDFIEQTTTKLAKENNIAIENLTNSKLQFKNKNRRRLIVLYPLNKFIEKLEWKCKKFNREFVKVNPAYTSQDCCVCGKRNINLKLKDRIFKCSCGNIMDRDKNAACNIVARGFC